jgi:putative Mg2+ transporter-C (MgtC) family protein
MSLQELLYNTEINFGTAILRLGISFLAGMLIGIEREAHSQPAGMRTHILIAIGSTLGMLISIYIPQAYPEFQNGDPGRIAAQVVTGIGFLGAGAILRFGANVRGLTTAASIWAMAMLGLTIGAGLFKISLVAALIILFSLTIMDVFEKHFFRDKLFKRIEITVRKKSTELDDLRNLIRSLGIRIQDVDIRKNTGETTDKFVFYVFIPVKLNPGSISGMIEKTEGVVAYSIEMVG